MFFSVITVCYNEGENIRRTLESILSQKCRDYELIICDGGSRDNTYDIVLSYRECFEKLGIPFYSQSEKDGGVYYGMNLAIRHATGDYCIFMNGGDCFLDSRCLRDVRRCAIKTKADVVYGDFCKTDGGNVEVFHCSADELPNSCSLGHQSSYIKTGWLKKRPYDVSLRIAADYDYWLYLKDQGAVFYHMKRKLCLFRLGGISSDIMECSRETDLVQNRYPQLKGRYPTTNKHFFYRYCQQNGLSNRMNGWWLAEPDGVWAIGQRSEFSFTMRHPHTVCLAIRIRIHCGYRNQLFVNDKYCCDIPEDRKIALLKVDRSLLIAGDNIFSIRTEDNVVPCAERNPNSMDVRCLNLFVGFMCILPAVAVSFQ